jgi:hypothetical protein
VSDILREKTQRHGKRERNTVADKQAYKQRSKEKEIDKHRWRERETNTDGETEREKNTDDQSA